MDHDTGATLLLDLEGFAVREVCRDAEGVRVVHVVTACETARACPDCGVIATRVKGLVRTRPRDLPHGGALVRMVWHKRRWVCRQARCLRRSFTESLPVVPARARTTGRLRRAAGTAVADGGRSVVQSGRDHGLSWPVVAREFTAYAAEVLAGAPESTEALGIDEVRRGRARWEQNPEGRWRLVSDCWHVGFVDAAGKGGLFGQVEGRTATAVTAWIAAQPQGWRAGIRYVAIDLCAIFRAAVRRALPHAQVVVDCFHLVQLANRKLAELRRRCTWAMWGRRGRRNDPEYAVRGLLRRNREDLTPEQLTTLTTTLRDLGTYGRWILAGWQAKEKLRDLLRLTFKHARVSPDRSTISQARYEFTRACIDSHQPELITLAETVEEWWDGIEAYLHTGITNAASEGNNRLIKLEARNAFGFRNTENQRLRSRCATTRRARRKGVPG